MRDFRDRLARLVAAPSISSVNPAFDTSNRPVIDLLAAWLGDLGFAIEVQPVPTQPHKANLVATLGRGPGGLVLAGHTDTVPCDPGLWTGDPFTLREADGHLVGLGAADMKGFLALAVSVAATIPAADLGQPLVILATADEESTMEGARALIDLGRPLGRYAVIGEPTSMRPVRAHKGIMMEAIRVIGRSGHSSDPGHGVSALEGMNAVMGALLDWRALLQREHRDAAFAVPVPTLNLGYVRGGDNPNRICGECDLHLDLRPLPGQDLDALRDVMRGVARAALVGRDLEVDFRSLDPGTPPFATPATAAIVTAVERMTGHAAEAASYCTEAPYLQALGLDVVVLGPGDIAQAHRPDEALDLAQVAAMRGVLEGLIRSSLST